MGSMRISALKITRYMVVNIQHFCLHVNININTVKSNNMNNTKLFMVVHFSPVI